MPTLGVDAAESQLGSGRTNEYAGDKRASIAGDEKYYAEYKHPGQGRGRVFMCDTSTIGTVSCSSCMYVK